MRLSRKLPLLLLPVVLLARPREARADVFGGDLPLLLDLAVNSFQQLKAVQDTLTTARKSYEEARRLAGYAVEAKEAFETTRDLGAQVFSGDVTRALDGAFPELAYFREEARRPGPWAHNTGDLGRMVRVCIAGQRCTEVREALTLQEARRAVTVHRIRQREQAEERFRRAAATAPASRDGVRRLFLSERRARLGSEV